MTDLIACLTSGKGSWVQVSTLLKIGDWNNTFLITNSFGKEKFVTDKKVEFVLVDIMKDAEDLKKDIVKQLDGRVEGTEVALNLVSGTGKEHMAIISALLSLGVGIRFVMAVKSELKEI